MNSKIKCPKAKKDQRSSTEILEHYEIEKELANKLRQSSTEERQYLYTALYDEMFQRVPHHPLLIGKKDTQARFIEIFKKINLLKRFLKSNYTFLEVGPGDCALSFEICKHVKKVYAIDVSKEITSYNQVVPENFELIISNGSSIPVAEGSINLAYSDQLMEHLHPDDALKQLKAIYQTLTAGGTYICSTPNRLSGPHDISSYFDEVATGFHLKEYTVTELSQMFYQVGFSQIRVYISVKGLYIKIPLSTIKIIEFILEKSPYALRKRLVYTIPLGILLGMTISGTK
jgi:SAM-dependent methyltransferase